MHFLFHTPSLLPFEPSIFPFLCCYFYIRYFLFLLYKFFSPLFFSFFTQNFYSPLFLPLLFLSSVFFYLILRSFSFLSSFPLHSFWASFSGPLFIFPLSFSFLFSHYLCFLFLIYLCLICIFLFDLLLYHLFLLSLQQMSLYSEFCL